MHSSIRILCKQGMHSRRTGRSRRPVRRAPCPCICGPSHAYSRNSVSASLTCSLTDPKLAPQAQQSPSLPLPTGLPRPPNSFPGGSGMLPGGVPGSLSIPPIGQPSAGGVATHHLGQGVQDLTPAPGPGLSQMIMRAPPRPGMPASVRVRPPGCLELNSWLTAWSCASGVIEVAGPVAVDV